MHTARSSNRRPTGKISPDTPGGDAGCDQRCLSEAGRRGRPRSAAGREPASPWAPCTQPLVLFPAGAPPPAQGSGRWGDRKSARAPTEMQGTEEIYTHSLLGTFLTELGRNGHQIAFFIDLHYYGRWPFIFFQVEQE